MLEVLKASLLLHVLNETVYDTVTARSRVVPQVFLTRYCSSTVLVENSPRQFKSVPKNTANTETDESEVKKTATPSVVRREHETPRRGGGSKALKQSPMAKSVKREPRELNFTAHGTRL